MNKKLEHLLHQLNGKNFPEDFYREFLEIEGAFQILYENSINIDQGAKFVCNALSVMQFLCRKESPENRALLLDLALNFSKNQNIKIRSKAIHVIIGLYRLFEEYPEFFPSSVLSAGDIKNKIRDIISMGLDKEVEGYAYKYISNEISF